MWVEGGEGDFGSGVGGFWGEEHLVFSAALRTFCVCGCWDLIEEKQFWR